MILDLSVTLEFKQQLKKFTDELDAPPASRQELYNFLDRHERIDFVMKQLGSQIQTMEHKFGPEATITRRSEIIKMTARYFAYVAIKARGLANMSQLARVQTEIEAQRQKNETLGLKPPDASGLKGKILEMNPDGSTQEII